MVISASVCYDATDLALASDLKGRSDFYIICALNKDVGTFDRMAEGLHYHMFQAVMVVNNGQFGGSNLFIPFEETYHRQVLHFHGQPRRQLLLPRSARARWLSDQRRWQAHFRMGNGRGSLQDG
jgi:hypothetical protein